MMAAGELPTSCPSPTDTVTTMGQSQGLGFDARVVFVASVQSVIISTCVFFHRLVSDSVRDQLMVTIQKTFNYSRSQAQQIYLMVMECMKKKALVGIQLP